MMIHQVDSVDDTPREDMFKSFLESAVNDSFNLQRFSKIHAVLGSPACDLDSAASTLAAAYLINRELLRQNPRHSEAVLPIFNVQRSQLRLKTEVIFILNFLKVPINFVIPRSDVDLESLASSNKLELTLVDHHLLPPSDKSLIPSVVCVMDHRPKMYEWNLPECKLTIEQVASCSTLVAYEIWRQHPHSLEHYPCEIFQLLYGAVLLDTRNLRQCTKTDQHVIERIEACLMTPTWPTRLQTYEALLDARRNIVGMSLEDILAKDCKLASGIPVCSLTTLVKEFATNNGVVHALHELELEFDAQGAVLMGISIDENGTVQRDVGIFSSTDKNFASKLVAGLQAESGLESNLVAIPDISVRGLNVYVQMNVKISRKVIFPYLAQTLQSMAAANLE